ncbi:MAG: PQQ-binding-like beta-propeller repeat protein [Gammaproteobacteria bacterium]
MNPSRLWVVSLVLVLASCGQGKGGDSLSATAKAPKNAAVDAARLAAAASDDGANWITHGRTYDEQRFSPLKKISAGNVAQLKMAWHYDLDTAHRVQESSPLVIDGVMYVTSAWSKVFALNAATGAQLWAYDPKVPGEWGINACCDVANRGVAAWNGKVFVGTLDGRLVALDAATGKPVWDVLDVVQPADEARLWAGERCRVRLYPGQRFSADAAQFQRRRGFRRRFPAGRRQRTRADQGRHQRSSRGVGSDSAQGSLARRV